MRENFEYDENSINSISSYNKSPYNIDPPKRNFFKEQSTKLPNLIINIVLIDSLNELIDETYEIILDIAEDVINDF